MYKKTKKQKLYLIKSNSSMKKVIITALLSFFASFFVLTQWMSVASADLLDDAVEPSKEQGQMIDIGNNATAVGNFFFKSMITADGLEQPLYIRIVKTILRATLVIAVTMGLLIGVRYILAQDDEKQQKTLQWYLVNIAIGILIALSALAIVELILSLTRSTLSIG